MSACSPAESTPEALAHAAPAPGENPYAAAIRDCQGDHHEMQRLYAEHRARRAAHQRELFLAADWGGLVVDQHLVRLERPRRASRFRDERHCLALWARPPAHILRLAQRLQDRLAAAAPGAWLMPTYRMHLTALDISFARPADDIARLVSALRPALPALASFTHAPAHRARLVRPLVSYDLSAFALGFVPAAGEPPQSPAAAAAADAAADAYSYHHLRRDLFDAVAAAGVDVASRYHVPSAHVTLGRFLDDADHDTPEKRAAWVEAVDDANRWLEQHVWHRPDADFVGEWLVGQERGLDVRDGTLWYGGGRSIMAGEGF